ncbi:hypothetical protein ACH47B_13025 [Rhodococcus sp. NPDC019627]|uniref:hypothetical protein n=1 Tax=unclassified Rhodococcus (in: high G+C Gram-positive bacteria) TaxID=192944 RepID=UPI0033E71844
MSESITVPVETHLAASRALVLLVNENAELRSEAAYQCERADRLAKDLAVAVGHPCVAGVEAEVDEPISYALVEELEPEVATVRVPRVFHHGDVIPEDVKVVEAQPWSSDDTQYYAFRNHGGGWEFATLEDAIRLAGKGVEDEGFESFSGDDYPLTEVLLEAPESVAYTLREAAEILNQQGIDTGQNRLKNFLNTGIAWTDGFGSPRPVADKYLVETDKANGHRPAVVRVTPEGVSELARVMGMAV